MNKDLFENFRKLNLPLGKYAIFGSGPMAIRGLRKSADIDLVVADSFLKSWKSCRNGKKKNLVWEAICLFIGSQD